MLLKKQAAKLSFALLSLCLTSCNLPTSEEVAEHPKSSTSLEIIDSEVTTLVNTALLNDINLEGLKIEVVTTKGDVALYGFVDNPSQMIQAEKIAHDMIGAHSVHNHLEVNKSIKPK
jgi:osmotically-inducible protein OsmY